MANINVAERPLVNGFHPVSVSDIETTMNDIYGQAEHMKMIFLVILRLTTDPEIIEMCKKGQEEAVIQANDIDVIREQAMMAGVDAVDVRHTASHNSQQQPSF